MKALDDALDRLDLGAAGWSASAYEHPFEGPYVVFEGKVTNSCDGEATVLKVRSPVPPLDTVERALDWLLWRWLIICSHEGREFFRVDGAAWSDPHKDDA